MMKQSKKFLINVSWLKNLWGSGNKGDNLQQKRADLIGGSEGEIGRAKTSTSDIGMPSKPTTNRDDPTAAPGATSSTNFTMAGEKEVDQFAVVERIMLERRCCKRFDENKPVDEKILKRIMKATIRSPTAFNLQGWVAVVVKERARRQLLYAASMCQPAVLEAPLTVVFAGNLNPEKYAPFSLEAGLKCGYYSEFYGSIYLRQVNYLLQDGPFKVYGLLKNKLSSVYTSQTGIPGPTIPRTKQAYAWKQTMIPVSNFITLATAAGLHCNIMEGIDEEVVMNVVGLPRNSYTIPCIVSVGYPAAVPGKVSFYPMSPRFPYNNFVHLNHFGNT